MLPIVVASVWTDEEASRAPPGNRGYSRTAVGSFLDKMARESDGDGLAIDGILFESSCLRGQRGGRSVSGFAALDKTPDGLKEEAIWPNRGLDV